MATLPVAIDARGATAGAAVFGRATKSMGFSARGAQGAVKGLIGVIAALAAIQSSIRTMSSFELTMRKVQGVTAQTDAQMGKMIKTARELGATTQFTATQAGEGLLFLSRAGFTAAESISALPSTLNLAAAAGLELGFAADLASNVLRQFSLEATETTRVVDALVRVSNQANTDVRQLGEAMKFAGPIAGALGKSVEETAVMIGLLGDAGIQASMAGTNMRGTMLALTAPTGAAKAALAELHLTVKEINPATNKMSVIFDKFKKAGLTAAQAAAIFGRRNAAAGLILAQSSGRIDSNVASLFKMNDAATIAAMNMDTLSGSFKALVSAVQESFIALGDSGFSGGLRSIIDLGTDVVRTLVGVEGELKNNRAIVEIIVFALKAMFVRWGLLIGLKLIIWLKGVGIALLVVKNGMLAFNAAIMANPIGLLVSAAALAIVWLVDLGSEMVNVKQITEEMTDRMKRFQEASIKGSLDFLDFGGRLRQTKDLLSLYKDQLVSIEEQIKGGVFAFDPSELKKLTGIDFATKKFGLGVDEKSLVAAKQAVVTLEILILSRENDIRKIKEQKKAYEAKIEAQLKATELDRIEAKRVADVNRSIAVLQRESSEIEFQNKIREKSIETIARLTAERRINTEWSKIQAKATADETIEFHELSGEVIEAAIAFAKLQQAQNLDEFTQDLKRFASEIGKTEDELELIRIEQEAYNIAVRNGVTDVDAFVAKIKALAIVMQENRKVTEQSREETEQWNQVATQSLDMILDGIVDIAIEGANAKDVIKDLIKEISKLFLKRQLLNLVASFGAGIGAGAGTGAGSGLQSGSFGGNFGQGQGVKGFGHGGLLVKSPTAFPMGTNLIGEAGKPEFVLPSVTKGGQLGVELVVAGRESGSTVQQDNRRQNFYMTFYDRGIGTGSFKRNTLQSKRDAVDFVSGR